MLTQRLLPFLVVAAMGCNEASHPTSAVFAPDVDEEGEQFATVYGTVVSTNELRAQDGRTVELTGPQTALLAGLVDAEIQVRGTWDEIGPSPLYIVEFRVVMVDNLPALDGILAGGGGGFSIQSGEEAYELPSELPQELTGSVGKRVWLTLRDEAYVRYGVLEMM